MKTPYDSAIGRHRTSGCDDPQCRIALDQQSRRKGYVAALKSPQVTALRTALIKILDELKGDYQGGWFKDALSALAIKEAAEAALAPWKRE